MSVCRVPFHRVLRGTLPADMIVAALVKGIMRHSRCMCVYACFDQSQLSVFSSARCHPITALLFLQVTSAFLCSLTVLDKLHQTENMIIALQPLLFIVQVKHKYLNFS